MVRRREEELLDSVDSGKERAIVEDRGRGIRPVLGSVQLVWIEEEGSGVLGGTVDTRTEVVEFG